MRWLVAATAAMLSLGQVAWADGPVLPLPAKDQQEITSLLGPGIVGKALPSQPIGEASSYFPLEERSSIFQVTAGKHAGENQTLHTTKGRRPGGNDAWRFELSPTLAGFISRTGADLMMPAVSDSGEGVIVVTTPANPFVLSGMKPGESRSFAQTVSVNYLDDPTDQRYAGSLQGTYTYVGTYELSVPAGTYPAVLLRLDYAGKVGPAHTQDTAYYFFAPKVGVVAMISQEDVEAFWVIHIDSRSGKVLASQ
jgi:hypothetical protein